jgi:hypothetical protein
MKNYQNTIDIQLSRNKTLRTCYSTHVNKSDPFEFLEIWEYRGKDIEFNFVDKSAHKMVLHFENSFINCFINVDHQLHFEQEKDKMTPFKINDDEIKKYIEQIEDKIPQGLEILNVSKSDYTLITLKNNNGYECPTCKEKFHEKENPFISITINGIFFNCRRSSEKKSTCLISFSDKQKNKDLLMDDVIRKFVNKEYNHPNDVSKDLIGVIAFSYAGVNL